MGAVALHGPSRIHACDSLALLPSATADGLGGLYAKNADRSRNEAQPLAVHQRTTHPAGTTIQLDTGLTIPQVPLTYGHAGSRPIWASSYGGYSEGVNEFGVGIGNEYFPSRHLPTDDGRKPQASIVQTCCWDLLYCYCDLRPVSVVHYTTAASRVSLMQVVDLNV